jgi:hypothetical protein
VRYTKDSIPKEGEYRIDKKYLLFISATYQAKSFAYDTNRGIMPTFESGSNRSFDEYFVV